MVVKNNIFRNEDGTVIDCGNRDLLLITYGKILERMNNNAKECAKAYEDYLQMSWSIEAQVNLVFNYDINKLETCIIFPSIQIGFKTEKDKELFEELKKQSEEIHGREMKIQQEILKNQSKTNKKEDGGSYE